jgi:hypothetical protein
MITIEQIKTELREMIALGDAATAEPWLVDSTYYVETKNYFFCVKTNGNAAFIARSRTMTPLACKGLLLAIEGLEDVPNDTADAIERRIIQLWEESK